MNILLVGAGSVGKVYGRHLAMGGAKVSFLVKEKYAEAARAGFTFYVLNERTKRDQAQAWRHFSVLTQISEVKNKKWDYILLCMASTGLKGPWLDKLIAVSGDATYVSLQPGLNDQDYLLTKLPANRLIAGTIPIISYETPLPGEQRAVPGTAYWIPPGGTAAFSG
ncbi:MAG: ketopantoate reductase, partial [Bdellovibrionales bacterium]|nr:ketopantoate reductase [Oligoflexia bacterium]